MKIEDETAALLVEIEDALSNPAFEMPSWNDHIRRINDFLLDHPNDPLCAPLVRAREIVSDREGKEAMELAFARELGREQIVKQLRSRLPAWPMYLYHGTSSKSLPSIARSGLRPAFSKSHWSRSVDSAHLESGVFFATTWRAAFSWAFSASHTRQGTPRKGALSAVIRVLAVNITISPDRWATQKDCFVSSGSVDAVQAEVIVGHPTGIPEWKPIASVA